MCGTCKTKLFGSVRSKWKWPEKFFFCVNLKIGLNVWFALETAFWFILFLIALYHQVIYFTSIDLRDFGNACNDSYCKFIFGGSAGSFDHKIRCEFLVVGKLRNSLRTELTF